MTMRFGSEGCFHLVRSTHLSSMLDLAALLDSGEEYRQTPRPTLSALLIGIARSLKGSLYPRSFLGFLSSPLISG